MALLEFTRGVTC